MNSVALDLLTYSAYNLRKRAIIKKCKRSKRRIRKKEVQQSQNDLNKLPFPGYNMHDECSVNQVHQYEQTCWMASVIFIILNSSTLWDKMNRTVQNFALEFLACPIHALGVGVKYDLREIQDTCRRIPKKLADMYLKMSFYDTRISSDTGGREDNFLRACAKISGWSFDRKDISIYDDLEKYELSLWTRVYLPSIVYISHLYINLFDVKLDQILKAITSTLHEYECIACLLVISSNQHDVLHAMGCVRCNDSQRFKICQSYFLSGCQFTDQLHNSLSPALLDFDTNQRTRQSERIFIRDIKSL